MPTIGSLEKKMIRKYYTKYTKQKGRLQSFLVPPAIAIDCPHNTSHC